MTTYTTFDFLFIRIGDLRHGIEHNMGATKFSFLWSSLQRYCTHEGGGGDWGDRHQGKDNEMLSFS